MKIVIIDDVQMNVTLLKHLVLKLPDSQAICFTNPVLALQWCLDNDPDLVVVDFMMPELSGTELTQRFRARYPDTPVLMVTANHEMELRHQALEIGVTDFLNKPINNTEFLARAKNMLALNKSHKHLAAEVRQATAKLVEQERETIFCLAKAAEYRDPETGAHILRMAHYSKHIASVLGLPQDQQDLLLQAAPMHDIGKVGTPDMILLKPGKLTPEEFAVMKLHAVIGYEVLNANSSHLLKVAAEIAHTHHEKFDGSGYPRGLKGQDIPLFGRIVAVADVFDALTSERPYKKAWSVEDAANLIKKEAGSHFDPACVNAFFTDFDHVLAIKQQFMDDPNEQRNDPV
ncbi:HD domain-containing phosphohydrolase [Rhodoferax sp.]|uniref:HD domain-containing phosphohydrolase n=1 Tax=Rhodoferax sp. TaxID=50421 RepID=UPI00262FEB9B|nr:HD domain-containing phosphohydrolase [Rhodoferax sp.]MDD2811775.1 response regulator [Rhodoferax sp.]